MNKRFRNEWTADEVRAVLTPKQIGRWSLWEQSPLSFSVWIKYAHAEWTLRERRWKKVHMQLCKREVVDRNRYMRSHNAIYTCEFMANKCLALLMPEMWRVE